MKTETRQKLVKCIDKLQSLIKGGPGSGPRPGGGGRIAARASNAAASASNRAFNSMRKIDRYNHEEHLSGAYRARNHSDSGNHAAAAEQHHRAAVAHRDLAANVARTDVQRNLHLDAARLHSAAADAHSSLVN